MDQGWASIHRKKDFFPLKPPLAQHLLSALHGFQLACFALTGLVQSLLIFVMSFFQRTRIAYAISRFFFNQNGNPNDNFNDLMLSDQFLFY